MRRTRTLRAPGIAIALAVAIVAGTSIGAGSADPAGARTLDAVPAHAASSTAPDPSAAARASVSGPSAPRPAEPAGELVVRVPRNLAVRAHPSASARVVGTMPSGSRYYDVAITAWVEAVSPDGRWGRVEIPYVWPRRHGWIALGRLARHRTDVQVHVDLSEHRITVTRAGRTVFGMPAATGAAVSPTPPGEYFVTDRIPFSGGYLGTFAFGISGIQPNLPPGWSGGDQLAIHGTNDPSSIGRSASAGCLRVSERSLDRLKPLLQLGTPVVVEP
jgi:lipoprotein-anchoring transpeptidase ErfK/SrfK